eukprot:1160596-Pelagomonas_calceolata.AAC.7
MYWKWRRWNRRFSCYQNCYLHAFLLPIRFVSDLLEVKVVGRMPARRSKLYYLLDHERSSNMKFQPPVVNAANIKPEGERGAQERVGSQKGKSKKSKKK